MDKSKEQGFSNCSALNEEQSRLALTLLKREFEAKFHLLLSDKVFLEIFQQSFEENKPKYFPRLYTISGVSRPTHTTESLRKCGYSIAMCFPYMSSYYNRMSTIRRFFDEPQVIEHARYRRLIIHTPHAGKMFPKDLLCHYYYSSLGKDVLEKCTLLIDHYTDELYAADPKAWKEDGEIVFKPYDVFQSKRLVQVSSQICRVLCDVERLENDPLEEKGLGIAYDLTRILRDNSYSVNKALSMYYYDLHQAELKGALEQTYLFPLDNRVRQEGGNCANHPYQSYRFPYYEETKNMPLLLDCHSFSERDNLLSPEAHKYKAIDICIGYNQDRTQPDDNTLHFVADFFRQKGYNVEYNVPFSNSKTVDTDKPYHSLMIEVNKHCYMNEDTLEKTEGFEKLHKELQELYRLLLNW